MQLTDEARAVLAVLAKAHPDVLDLDWSEIVAMAGYI